MTEPIMIRKSMLESYEFCPRQFYNQFILGRSNGVNQKMLIGTRFHEWAHTFFDYAEVVDPLDWIEFIPYEDLNDEEVKMFEWFIDYQKGRWQDLKQRGRLDEFRLIYKELFMKCEHLQLQSTVDGAYWVDKAKGFVGLIEYKTGQKVNEDSAFRQLAFYAYLWEESGLPGRVVELLLINPRLQIARTCPFTLDMREAAIRKVRVLRTAIDTGNFPYHCTDGKFAACKLCELSELPKLFPDDGLKRFSDIYKVPQLQEHFG